MHLMVLLLECDGAAVYFQSGGSQLDSSTCGMSRNTDFVTDAGTFTVSEGPW